MNISLTLPKETAEKLESAASRAGQDVPSFLEDFLNRAFSEATAVPRSVEKILAPFRAEVEASGLTEPQLDTLFTEARARVLANRSRPQE